MSGWGLGAPDGLKVPIPLYQMVESTLKPAKVTLTQALEKGVIKSDASLANPDYAACFSMPRQ